MKTYLITLALIIPLSIFAQKVDSINIALNISVDGQIIEPYKVELAVIDSGNLKTLFTSKNNMINVPKNSLSNNNLILIVNDVVIWAHSNDFEWLSQQTNAINAPISHVNLLIFTKKKSIRKLVKEYGLNRHKHIILIGKFCSKGIVNISSVYKSKNNYYNIEKIRALNTH